MERKKISAFDAKTHLSELLRETEAGHEYVILRRGKPVATLGPVETKQARRDFKAIAAELKKFRSKIKGKIKARELIEEGRRF